uniref:Peptidase C-terminal archaeal/bacterial domain-containing protein n=1 Tax=uncultured bacterium A1Q1_fos_1880 TaxID=1256556 RepID=L7VVZ5_9BACT|nr:hypothetical protein [uncultured bacterium A1Q1_fos_1880]
MTNLKPANLALCLSVAVTLCLILVSCKGPGDFERAPAAPMAYPMAYMCGGSIKYGGSISDEIFESGTKCVYEFDGTAGDVVAIHMEYSEFTWVLELIDPENNVLMSNTSDPIQQVRLPTTGIYQLIVRSYHDEYSGSFQVTLERVEDTFANQLGGQATICGSNITDGQVIYGALTGSMPVCSYTFLLPSSIEYSLDRTVLIEYHAVNDEWSPHLDLVGPNGLLISWDNYDFEGDDILIQQSDGQLLAKLYHSNGKYTIFVRSSDFQSVGRFELTVKFIDESGSESLYAPVCGGDLRYGDTIGRKMSEPEEECRFHFWGDADDVINIRITNSTMSGPDILLIGPDGYEDFNAVRTNNENNIYTYHLNYSGDYTIITRFSNGITTNPSELSLTKGRFAPSDRVRNVSNTTIDLGMTIGYWDKFAQDILDIIYPGDMMTIVGGSQEADGMIWWQVQYTNISGQTLIGWVAETTLDGQQILTLVE